MHQEHVWPIILQHISIEYYIDNIIQLTFINYLFLRAIN